MMAKKYRKKPVIIEAVRWNGDNRTEVELFYGGKLECSVVPSSVECEHDDIPHEAYTITIPTLEGNMTAIRGDYIIKGIKGEFYPCKPDIFKATYEEVK